MNPFTADQNYMNIFQIIKIDQLSVTPIYKQIVTSILKGIEDEYLTMGYSLPSINDLSFELDISRDTCVRAYNELKCLKVVASVPGKGYFIKNTDIKRRIKVLLIFNKLSTHKKIIYDSFASTLGDDAFIDFYIYDNNVSLFKRIFSRLNDDYSYYVIIPHFLEDFEKAFKIINKIPKDRLILMDKLIPDLSGNYGAVYEDFELDIFNALEGALERLRKYHTIKIIFPEHTYYPSEILKGLRGFCYRYNFSLKEISELIPSDIAEGDVFITLNEDDLVILIESILDSRLVVGKQIGVISYNEIPLKKIILNGITTISTDFNLMGQKAAELILDRSVEQIAIPFKLILRESL